MQQNISRRRFLQVLGMAAGTAIVGFDPRSRSWVSVAHAAEGLVALPPLDGRLLADPATLAAAADDFGHIKHHTPIAVLQPGSVEDIRRMVRFAREHHLKIAARGQAHSTYGQPQVEAGVVVDMKTLATIHEIGEGYADVDAGVLWSDLVDRALGGVVGSQQSQTPPVLTDYIHLSVGGTIAVGGIGGMSSRFGAQVDNVFVLTVVTGEGEIRECSKKRNPDLFTAVLGGLGQYAIVVRATVRLVPAPEHVQVVTAYYNDLETFTHDQQRLISGKRFDYVEGQLVDDKAGGWRYMLEAGKYDTHSKHPNDHGRPDHRNDAALLAGLHYDSLGPASTLDYRDFAYRLDPVVKQLQGAGLWAVPHPWFNVFVPGKAVVEYIRQAAGQLRVEDINGPALLYPMERRRFTDTRLQLPKDHVVFLFSLLRFALPMPGAASVEAMLVSNRHLYDQVVALGGKNYPIGAIPGLDQKDWEVHYDGEWDEVVADKRRYDPDNVLTPGQGIFA